MIVFILDEKDEFHFGSRFDELLVDIQKGDKCIEIGF
jgi:hypothetical protein